MDRGRRFVKQKRGQAWIRRGRGYNLADMFGQGLRMAPMLFGSLLQSFCDRNFDC